MTISRAAMPLFCLSLAQAAHAAPAEDAKSGGPAHHHRHDGSGSITPRSLLPTPISSAFSGNTVVAACNVGPADAVTASEVITLHLTSAVLGHLTDGTACAKGACLIRTDAKKVAISGAACPAPVQGQPAPQCVDGDSGLNAQPGPGLQAPINGSNYNTRFDIDLRNEWASDGNGGYRPILIQVSLDNDPTLDFIGHAENIPGNAVQMGMASTDAQMFTCLQGFAGSGNTKTIAFRAVKLTPNGRLMQGSLNIDLLVMESGSGFKTPLIIDPKVPNSGVDLGHPKRGRQPH